MASLIAYSMAARADLVNALLEHDQWRQAFRGFRVSETASLDADTVIRDYWSGFGAVRGMQLAGVARGVAPAVLDLYFLTYGGQSSTVSLLRSEYQGWWVRRPFWRRVGPRRPDR
jgi:hypothetical protein